MKNPINNIITISKVLFLIIILNCISCTNTKSYEPSIIYNQTDTNCEVRLTLPNGESKVILKVDEPLLESGKKSKFTDEMISFFDRDSSFKLVHTSYIIIERNTYFHFYIFKKNNHFIVYKTENDDAGIGENKVIFEGDVYELKGDKIEKNDNSKAENKKNEIKIINYVNDVDSKNTIILKIDGEKVELTEYSNGNTENSFKGKFLNNKIYIESEYISYEFDGNKLRVSDEGYEAFYTKQNESINGETLYKYDNIGEIRNLVIAGGKRNFLKRLGQPNEEYSAYNFLDKYFNNKFNINSIYWGSAILHGEVYVYNNLTNKPIIIVYNSIKDIVKEVLFIEDVSSINDVAIR